MSALSKQMKLRQPAAATAGQSEADPVTEKDVPVGSAETQPESNEVKPKHHATLNDAVRATPYTPSVPQHSKAKTEALQARDQAIEEAARFADMRPDAQQKAQEAKATWSKAADKLGEVKEAHQDWRQGHRISSWLHDKGLWKNGTLSQHEDRERRHTSHEAKLFDKHSAAGEEVQRLDAGLSRAQEQARQGWAKLDAIEKQEQKQSTGGGSRGPEPSTHKSERGYQNHEAISHTAGTAALAGGKQDEDAPKVSAKERGMTGVLVAHGPAPYKNDPENPENYFVTLKTDQGKEATHWGKDLGRALNEADARTGDRVQLKRTGDDQNVEVEEKVRNEQGQVIGVQETHAVRRGWSVSNLSNPKLEPSPEIKPEAPQTNPAPRTLASAVASRSPFAGIDSADAKQPDPSLHPEVPGQKRRVRM